MPAVLTVSSTVTCSHGGSFTFTAQHDLLTVDGVAVVRKTELAGAVIAGCGHVGTGLTPCLAVTSILGGLATTLAVGDDPVALATANGVTNSTPDPGTWSVTSAGQTKLEAT